MNMTNFYKAKEILSDKHAIRAISQLEYAIKVNESNDHQYDDIIKKAVEVFSKAFIDDSVITKQTVNDVETILMPMSKVIKALKVFCVSHAHIDMNWMWGYHETVSIILSSFKTMLELMNEYPDFKFSQSQAAIYEIVEKYDPDMLKEIKKRVHERRWEITASSWVENDKNMVSGESIIRQVLYAKKYISKTFDIDSKTMNIGFEPDTFGHSAQLPEIYSKCGIKYYYFCRGSQSHHVFNWESQSGQKLIAYQDPIWYLGAIHPYDFSYLPKFVKENKLTTAMKVYGVGNHGGGATRKDINTIIEMNSWPLMPKFVFSTYNEFFESIEVNQAKFPTLKHELNPIFPGCYTSQVRIKQGNRKSEKLLQYAEKANVLAQDFKAPSLKNSWHHVLFNQFHDIITGSGVLETKEYAMAKYQEVYAESGSVITKALKKISDEIDTSMFKEKESFDDTAFGAGGGFSSATGNFSSAVCQGKTRLFTIFNLENDEISKVQEITLWDYDFDVSRISVKDWMNQDLEFEIVDVNKKFYWSHHYQRILVYVSVPGNGYTTIKVSQNEAIINDFVSPLPKEHEMRLHDDVLEYVLENRYLKAIFSKTNGSIIYLYDKKNGQEIVSKEQETGYLRYVIEDASQGMSAWKIGQQLSAKKLTSNVKIHKHLYKNTGIKQTFGYETYVNTSKINVLISLDKESHRLDVTLDLDWQEIGSAQAGIPTLDFYFEANQFDQDTLYEIPMGTALRKQSDVDLPALNFIYRGIGKSGVMMHTKNGYAFKSLEHSIKHTLIRSSFDPDSYPEIGKHKLDFSLEISNIDKVSQLYKQSISYTADLYVLSTNASSGFRKLSDVLFSLDKGNSIVSTIKNSELNQGVIIRFVEVDGNSSVTQIKGLNKDIQVFETNHLEEPIKALSYVNEAFELHMSPYQVKTVLMLKNQKA